MWGRDITFDWPHGGLLLFMLLPIAIGALSLARYRRHQQDAYAPSPVLSQLLVPRSPLLQQAKIFGWIAIWTLCCFALMGPFGNIRYPSLHSSSAASADARPHYIPHEVIFLVDTSASMGVPDGAEGETRLDQAKGIMEDIIRQLKGQTISLYAFTSELSALVPPTVDYLFVRLSIKELHLDEGDVGGTLFAPVLTALKQQAFPEPSPKRYTLIMLTDGGDTQLESLQGEALEKEKQSILTAISNPQQLHLRLFTIGLGSSQPQTIPHVSSNGQPVLSQQEPEILKQLAAAERGKYYNAQEETSWDLSQDIIAQMGNDPLTTQQDYQGERQVAKVKREDIIVDLYYQIPLGLALVFYLMNLLLPDVRRL